MNPGSDGEDAKLGISPEGLALASEGGGAPRVLRVVSTAAGEGARLSHARGSRGGAQGCTCARKEEGLLER